MRATTGENNLLRGQLLLSFFVILLLASSILAAESQLPATFKAIDIYGSSRPKLQDFITRNDDERWKNLYRLYKEGDHGAFQVLKTVIEADIRKIGDFPYVALSVVEYFTPDRPVYLTIDIVESAEKEARLWFRPTPPHAPHVDPDSLIAAWTEYQNLGFKLLRDGKLPNSQPKCEAFHCIFGFDHPELAKYRDCFDKGAEKHKAALSEILRTDPRAEFRSVAALLLAHTKDGPGLVQSLLPTLGDPAEVVRNNALRVLACMATDHPEIDIPVGPIIVALNGPSTLDRNKAGAVLVGLSQKEGLRTQIATDAGRILVRMLRLAQPNNHDPAYAILKNVSGHSFGERDYDRWERWLEALTAVHPPFRK